MVGKSPSDPLARSPLAADVAAGRQAVFDRSADAWIDRCLTVFVQLLNGGPAHQHQVVGGSRSRQIPSDESQDGPDLSPGDGALVPPDAVEVFNIVRVDLDGARVAQGVKYREGTFGEFLFASLKLLIDLVSDVPPDAFPREWIPDGFLAQLAESDRREGLSHDGGHGSQNRKYSDPHAVDGSELSLIGFLLLLVRQISELGHGLFRAVDYCQFVCVVEVRVVVLL
mmetsp:Transcript_8943/g.21843  ORF Transcript_8943/g.21843 Transcript_8943/m.21843 type:complete len:226 (+) Transcript_8943:373-1050(+)